MKADGSRRQFLKSAAAAALGGTAGTRAVAGDADSQSSRAGASASAAAPLPIKKGILLSMLPKKLSYSDRLKMARDAGFEGVQVDSTPDLNEADDIKVAAEEARIKIDSVMNMTHWDFPLSSPDPMIVETGLQGMRTSLQDAKFWGARYVLLVPAVVNEQTSYKQAWVRSQAQIRKLIPLAEESGVVIAIEEVWNKFLLSPLEFAAYIDEFKSPWIKAWFDVGNVVLYGYPEDWIRTLGKRIVEVHLKDFKREGFKWVNLGEGSVNWPEVRKAFSEIGYTGFATTELPAGDEAYLRDVSQRVDRLVLGV